MSKPTNAELRQYAEDTLASVLPYEETWLVLATALPELLAEVEKWKQAANAFGNGGARVVDERDQARKQAERLAEALAAYRSALRSGERESDQLEQMGNAALAAYRSEQGADKKAGGPGE
jgi:F0F1-type ATP synthase membrane subunit b/b'